MNSLTSVLVLQMWNKIDLSGTHMREQAGHKRGSSKGFKWQPWTPNALGKHPFNILTEEIYND